MTKQELVNKVNSLSQNIKSALNYITNKFAEFDKPLVTDNKFAYVDAKPKGNVLAQCQDGNGNITKFKNGKVYCFGNIVVTRNLGDLSGNKKTSAEAFSNRLNAMGYSSDKIKKEGVVVLSLEMDLSELNGVCSMIIGIGPTHAKETATYQIKLVSSEASSIYYYPSGAELNMSPGTIYEISILRRLKEKVPYVYITYTDMAVPPTPDEGE